MENSIVVKYLRVKEIKGKKVHSTKTNLDYLFVELSLIDYEDRKVYHYSFNKKVFDEYLKKCGFDMKEVLNKKMYVKFNNAKGVKDWERVIICRFVDESDKVIPLGNGQSNSNVSYFDLF